MDVTAVAYPFRVPSAPATRTRDDAPYLRLVDPFAFERTAGDVVRRANSTRSSSRSTARARQLMSGIATIGVLAGLWLGAGSISRTTAPSAAHLPGAVATAHGYSYVVRSGDTLWSIASAMEPNGDPRSLVDELNGELHGGVLTAGMTLHLP